MATGVEVLQLLCPNAGWTIYGDDYATINWFGQKPAITQAQFDAGFAEYDVFKVEKDAAAIAAKNAAQAKLEALGLTPDDFKALGL